MGRLRSHPLRKLKNPVRGKTLTLWLTGVLLALLCLLPRPALAIEYEVFIDVDDEDDLNELLASDQISEDTFNTLIELRRRGVEPLRHMGVVDPRQLLQ